MKITLSCAMSLDGFLDDRTPERLILSNAEDFDAVDGLRAQSDAILVGAGTLRADDPRLLVRSPARIAARRARGQSSQPVKVSWTSSGDLKPTAKFFTEGESQKLIYAARSTVSALRTHLQNVAEVVEADTLGALLKDLEARGIQRLLVEGGARISSLFIDQSRVDVLRLAIAPVLVGPNGGARFAGRLEHLARLKLKAAETLGEMAVLTYER